jgi:hypothetical protein
MSAVYAGNLIFEIFNNETNEPYGYSEAIDDITFRQEAVPEPAVISLILIMGIGFISINRVFSQPKKPKA